MELTQIKYFVKLAELLNFTEAAKASFVAQSTLSISIKLLEEELGVKLFDRIGKKVYLTDSGNLFLGYARNALASLNNGVQELNAVMQVFKGKLCIGVTYSTSEILKSHLMAYTKKYPELKLSIIMFNTVEEIVNSLLANKLDLAITYKPEKPLPLVGVRPLSESPLSLIVSIDHPLAAKDKVKLKEISGYPFATFVKGMHTRSMVERLFAKNKIHIEPQIEVNDTNFILEMIATGHWISILSPISIRSHQHIKSIPIVGDQEHLSVCLMWLNGKSRQVICQTLLDELEKSKELK